MSEAAAATASDGGPQAAPHRVLITASVMLASIMQALDNTIANVALPRIQGSLSATQDQMAWVLTSYIIAAAIMTPPQWVAGRSGRAQARVPVLGGRIHRLLGAVRIGPVPAGDRHRPAVPGAVRRGADTDVASRAARHLPACAARARDGDLDHGRHHRPHPRPGTRGVAHRKLQLALGLLHQRSVRHPVVPRHPELHAGDAAAQVALRLLRLRDA